MQLNLAKLVQDMDRVSKATWRRVMIGDVAQLKFREDSITDHNLFDLMESHPQLSVRRFSQNAEKEAGADWEWWIGSDEFKWFRLRIQAKRVHGASYRELDHPGADDGDYQYQTLIDGCAKLTATYPFHVFYNGWRENRFDEEFVSGHVADCGPLEQELWGCAAMSSHTVMKLHLGSIQSEWSRRSNVVRYMPESVPWSQLFTGACPSYLNSHPDAWSSYSPSQIFRYMHRTVLITDLLGRGEIPDESSADPRDVPLNRHAESLLDQVTLHAELPVYASKAREAHRYFVSAGADYIEDNHNLRPGPYDDPFGEQPGLVSVLDLGSDPEADRRWQ